MSRTAGCVAAVTALACTTVGGMTMAAAPPTTTPAPTSVAATSVASTTPSPTTVAAGPATTVAVTATTVVTATTTAAPTTLVAPTTTAVATTIAAPTTTAAPMGISDDAIRWAKVAWAQFVADNFATPNAILDPCPLMTVAEANASVAALGLTPTDLPYGVGVYRDVVGVGITGISCGADLSEAASPAGATLFSVEVTILDGQAVLPQYVTRVGGRNTPIENAAPELGGEMFARCRDDPQFCVASWHGGGLVVTVKLDGPRTDESEAQVRRLLLTVAPLVVDNLGAIARAT